MNDMIEKIVPKSRRQESIYSFGPGQLDAPSIISRGNSLIPEPPSIKKNNNGGHSNNNRKV